MINNTRNETNERLATRIINARELGVVSVNSLAGKGGVPYLTQLHLDKIEDVATAIGKEIITAPKEYASGYTVSTIFIKYGNNVRGELQLIGQKALNIANAEHWVYDAFLGKPYTDYLNVFSKADVKEVATKLIERVRKPAIALTEEQRTIYNSYMSEVYKNARNIESGNELGKVILPTGIPSELSVESLLKTEELINGLKNGSVSKTQALNFLNGK